MSNEKLLALARLLEKMSILVWDIVNEETGGASLPPEKVGEERPVKEEKAPTFEEVRAALAEISRNGKTAEMKALLSKHGAVKLSDVKVEDYSALLSEAKELADA